MPKSLEISGDPRWDADLETVWQARHTERVASYLATARRINALSAAGVVDAGSASWYAQRAASLAEPRGARVASCGTARRHVACGCRTREVVIGCGVVQLCKRCARKYWGRVKRDIATALAARRVGAQRAYVLTLTVPHSGDLAVDRARLSELWARLGREARRHRWWTCYAATYEATPGTKGDGHMHMHVALLSAWVPYKEVHRHWRRMLGQTSHHLHFRYRHGCPVEVAARYIAKYASKGVDMADFTGAKAGELLVATYGRRRVTASRGFWLPRSKGCGCCGERYRCAPGWEERRVPGIGVLYREAELHGVRWTRYGPSQTELLLKS